MVGTSVSDTLLAAWAPPRRPPEIDTIARLRPLAGFRPSGEGDEDLAQARSRLAAAPSMNTTWAASVQAPAISDGMSDEAGELRWARPDRVRIPAALDVGWLLATLRGPTELISEALEMATRAREGDRTTPLARLLLGSLVRCGPLLVHTTPPGTDEPTMALALPQDVDHPATRYQVIVDDVHRDLDALQATINSLRDASPGPVCISVWDGEQLLRYDTGSRHAVRVDPSIDVLRAVRILTITSGSLVEEATWRNLEAVHEQRRAAVLGVAHPGDSRPVCAWSFTASSLLESDGWRRSVRRVPVPWVLHPGLTRVVDETHLVWHLSSQAASLTRIGPPPVLPDLLDGTAAPSRSALRALATHGDHGHGARAESEPQAPRRVRAVQAVRRRFLARRGKGRATS